MSGGLETVLVAELGAAGLPVVVSTHPKCVASRSPPGAKEFKEYLCDWIRNIGRGGVAFVIEEQEVFHFLLDPLLAAPSKPALATLGCQRQASNAAFANFDHWIRRRRAFG